MRGRHRARRHTHLISRTIVCVVSGAAIGTLAWSPGHAATYALDVLLRSYLIFLGTVMAHEAVHGHLGRTRRANLWWGRVALLGSMVPFTNFRKTHQLHHAHTNDAERDPDYFLRARSAIDLVLRAVAMPHHWFFWLRARGMIDRRDVQELALNYAGIVAVYAGVVVVVGPQRLALGMAPALVLTSLLLWYPFAARTHEGYSTGPADERSHNYYGRAMYWLSLGLSMHRTHHRRPHLSWLDLRPYVEAAPTGVRGFLPTRDMRTRADGL
jgi:fatty acid desaturase